MSKGYFISYFNLIVMIVLAGYLSSCNKSENNLIRPTAEKGVLDLRNWDFNKHGAIRLDGDWAFFWQKYLEPTDTVSTTPYYMSSNKGWSGNNIDGSRLAGTGYATYRLKIRLNKPTSDLALKITHLSTAYELYVNGVKVAANGVIGTNKSTTQPEYKPLLSIIDNNPNELNLILRVSNFHHFNGGMLQPIILGNYSQLNALDRATSRYSGLLYGILIIIGLFHLAFFIFRSKEAYSLYYSIYCLSSCIAYACTFEDFIFTLLGPDLWVVSYKIFLGAVPVFITALTFFYDDFFKGVIINWIKKLLVIMSALLFLFIVMSPVKISSYGEIAVAIYLIIMAMVAFVISIITTVRRQPGAIQILFCNLFFIFALVYDGAFLKNQIGGISLSHIGTIIYVVAISFTLSRRFASAFGKVELLSDKLVIANQHLENQNKNLEAEVEQRTQQIILAEKMATLGQLTANIAHEINTPLGAIKASINNIHESFISSTDHFVNLIGVMDAKCSQILFGIIKEALTQTTSMSPKDERNIKKVLIAELNKEGVDDSHLIADYFVRAGLIEIKPDYIYLLKHSNGKMAVSLLTEQLEQIINNRNIRVAIEKVSKIMFALKNYSRHNVMGEKSSTDIEADISSVITLYHSWFKKGIVIETNFVGLKPITCWADELNQVWTNIIMNAIQAIGTIGKITITTSVQGNWAIISFTDNGPGIPENIIDKIFDPFFTTKAHGEGSGLGLDIVKAIIKKHRGEITVNSKPGDTLFTIKIPYENES
jgi:two-component system NtrC family sensor kinase